jgi:hypothetical protein
MLKCLGRRQADAGNRSRDMRFARDKSIVRMRLTAQLVLGVGAVIDQFWEVHVYRRLYYWAPLSNEPIFPPFCVVNTAPVVRTVEFRSMHGLTLYRIIGTGAKLLVSITCRLHRHQSPILCKARRRRRRTNERIKFRSTHNWQIHI